MFDFLIAIVASFTGTLTIFLIGYAMYKWIKKPRKSKPKKTVKRSHLEDYIYDNLEEIIMNQQTEAVEREKKNRERLRKEAGLMRHKVERAKKQRGDDLNHLDAEFIKRIRARRMMR